MIFQLPDEQIIFPDPHLGEPDGLLAVGGDLSVERLLTAYCNGIFPWYSFRGKEMLWYCPMERFVIFPDEIHVSHSMRPLINSGRYHFSFNRAFDRVIRHCGEVNGRNKHIGAWLGDDIIEAYTRLHERGFCTSVEVWDGHPDNEQLVGGLYGVTIGRTFIGESMFSLAPSGSKLALIALARHMQERGLTMIDCQFETPHLKSMGGRHIPYDDYMKLLVEGTK